MKVCFDTNVLLDAIGNREGYQEAQSLITLAAARQIEGMIAGSSVTDVYYLARKIIGDIPARSVIGNLLTFFTVAEGNGDLCGAALRLPMKDFEDAVLAACAVKAGADVIVSRDEEFLRSASPIPVKRPKELLKESCFDNAGIINSVLMEETT